MDNFKFNFLSRGQLESLNLHKIFLPFLKILLCYEVFFGNLIFCHYCSNVFSGNHLKSLPVPECRTDLVSNLRFFLLFLPFCIVVFSVYFSFKFMFINSVFAVFRFLVNCRMKTNFWSVNYMRFSFCCTLFCSRDIQVFLLWKFGH